MSLVAFHKSHSSRGFTEGKNNITLIKADPDFQDMKALLSDHKDDDINMISDYKDDANVLFVLLGGSRKHPPHPSELRTFVPFVFRRFEFNVLKVE